MVLWKEFACSINIIKYSETCSNLQSWLLHFTPSSFEKYAEACALFLHHMRTSHLGMKDTLLPKDKMGKAKKSFELWVVPNKIWTRWLHPMKRLTDVTRTLHYIWRNRKHFQCFYRLIETRVKVWENEKCCGNTSVQVSVSKADCAMRVCMRQVIIWLCNREMQFQSIPTFFTLARHRVCSCSLVRASGKITEGRVLKCHLELGIFFPSWCYFYNNEVTL